MKEKKIDVRFFSILAFEKNIFFLIWLIWLIWLVRYMTDFVDLGDLEHVLGGRGHDPVAP